MTTQAGILSAALRARLSRALPQAAGSTVAPVPEVALARGRVHELCGLARCSLAVLLAGAMAGPVLWIAPGWRAERLHAAGMARFAAPERFVFADCGRVEDILWCAEEALRSGAAPLVVAELPVPPKLTPVRRLHLAAAAGGRGGLPLGLLLTPGSGGAPGVESRWHMAPETSSDTPAGRPVGRSAWTLQRLRARGAGPAAWRLHHGPAGLAAEPAASAGVAECGWGGANGQTRAAPSA